MKKITTCVQPQDIVFSFFTDPSGHAQTLGMRGVAGSGNVYIAGTNTSTGQGLLYEGPLPGTGAGGTWHTLAYPSDACDDVTLTACHGTNNGVNGKVQVVGAYQCRGTGKQNRAFLYEGSPSGCGTWTTIVPDGVPAGDVMLRSIMGGIAVGNCDSGQGLTGTAFLYDIKTKVCTPYAVPGSSATTLYGIWHNGGSSYTLVGGCSMPNTGASSQAFIVDFDAERKAYCHLSVYPLGNEAPGSHFTHFEAITFADEGGYNLAAMGLDASQAALAAFVHIHREHDDSFGAAEWTPIVYPGAIVTTGHAVYRDYIMGHCRFIGNGLQTAACYIAKVLK